MASDLLQWDVKVAGSKVKAEMGGFWLLGNCNIALKEVLRWLRCKAFPE